MTQITDTSNVHNAYPELPVYEYEVTPVPEMEQVAYIRLMPITPNQEASLLTIGLWESGSDGQFVILGNIFNFQADLSPWSKNKGRIIGTTVTVDSTTKLRRFCVFAKWQDSVDMASEYFIERGIFVGGDCSQYAGINPVITPADLYTAYDRGWIEGSINAIPDPNELKGYVSLYNKSLLLLTTSTPIPAATVTHAPGVIYKMANPMMKSPVVGQIQAVLKAGGYYTGTVDNEYWRLTYNAVLAYQKANGLSADGEVGSLTLGKMGIA